ncbi:MAG: hypothetical protein RIM84_10625 [Alphaproteobacteria bacterium]
MQPRNPEQHDTGLSETTADAVALAKAAVQCFADGDEAGGAAQAEQAIAAADGKPDKLERLAWLFASAERHTETVTTARAALALDRDRPGLWRTLAAALLQLCDYEAADMAFQSAFNDEQPDAEALTDIAMAFRRGGHMGIARHWIDRALVLAPMDLTVIQESGRIHTCSGEPDSAMADYDKALNLDPPEYVRGQLWAEKGATLLTGGALELAASAFEKSLTYRQQDKATLVQLATVLYRLGRYQDALKHFAAADWIDPEDPAVLSYLVHCRLRGSDWAGLDALTDRLRQAIQQQDDLAAYDGFMIFGLLNTPLEPDVRLKVAKAMAARAAERGDWSRQFYKNSFAHKPGPRSRLRIGYLSADFRDHSVATGFRHLLAHHDRDGFELHGYYTSHVQDEMTDEFRARFDRFHDVVHDDQLARRIANDKIDILVDMSGLVAGNRLNVLAQRPAPVQAHWLGYGNTTGADYVDYLITDPVTVPMENAGDVTENLVHLPGSFMPAGLDPADPLPPRRADYGLPEHGMVFANFNEHYKFDPNVFAIWMRLLQHTPDAVLWLVEGQREAQTNLRRTAGAAGIDPHRLIFSPRVSRSRHLARASLADLGLETLYHVGGVTTADCLVAGLPTLCVAGNNANARTSASLVTAAGLPELAVADADAYEAQALKLANDRATLNRYREILQARQAPLFDSAGAAQALEAAYREMWAIFEAGQTPRHIEISGQER